MKSGQIFHRKIFYLLYDDEVHVHLFSLVLREIIESLRELELYRQHHIRLFTTTLGIAYVVNLEFKKWVLVRLHGNFCN